MDKSRRNLFCKIAVVALFLLAGCLYVTVFSKKEDFREFPVSKEGTVAIDELEPIITPLLIDINAAGESELQLLPGIGQKKAASIVEFRASQGDFRACEDIMLVPGIKEGVYSKIKDFIYVEEVKDDQKDIGGR